jgi:hypothetical protein
MATTTRIASRFAPSRVASLAIVETKLAARAVPRVIRHLAPFAAWIVVSVALGMVVGIAAVILPPTGAFGIVAVVGVVLLWVMPDLPLVSVGAIRKAFFVMLIADLSVPYYYTVQVFGLPWISARRVATFALIAPFLLAVSSSPEIRARISRRFVASWLIFACAVGYLAWAFLSISTSMLPTESMSALTDAILSWYVPFFALVCIIEDENDIIFVLKVICFCAVFNSAAGLLEFFVKHRYYLDIFPKSMLGPLIQNNPVLGVLQTPFFRNGVYRASSIFITPLSFGEFEIVVIPIGVFFALHRKDLYEKSLGWAVVLGGLVGIFASGSRGAYLGLLTSMAVFFVIWAIRRALQRPASLAPAIIGLTGVISLATTIVLINVWGRLHNMVLGGAGEVASTEQRFQQWTLGMQFIKSNPITGHGFVLGGYILNESIDSYYLSLLLETGVPGFLFFTGLLALPIWYGLRNYLTDLTEGGAIAGAIACSFIAFSFYRLALSQRENHTLLFSLLAVVVVLNYVHHKARVTAPTGSRPELNPYYRGDRRGLRSA